MRRLPLLVCTFLVVTAPSAIAAAGGGSSGFGGGGGGGSSSSGGSSTFDNDNSDAVSGTAGLIGVGLALLFVLGVIVYIVAKRIASRRRARVPRSRVRRAEAAAAQAAQDDAAFSVEVVQSEAAALFVAIQAAWSADDRAQLRRLCGEDLCVEWERRLDDFSDRGWRNQVSVLDGPEIRYVGLVNRADDTDDRVVVRVEAKLEDVVVDAQGERIKRTDSSSETTELEEYWTLSKRDGHWRLLSIEQAQEGQHNVTDALIASPDADTRLQEDAVLELAAADAAGDAAQVATLVSLDYAGDARKAALDLSLVDGRFAPDVLETGARRAVAAWAEAVDGPDDALTAAARPAAVRELLYPTGDEAIRRVVRGPKLLRMTLVELDNATAPPRMVVELELSGRRYLEHRDTVALVSGSRDSETRWSERWAFGMVGDASAPGIIAGAGDVTAAAEV
jgi:predicted lipid-binding transport protein (Tim44 family)